MGWGHSHCGRWLARLRCGSALGLFALVAGCNDGPAEAPLVDAVPFRSIREAPAVARCEHLEPIAVQSPELVPLPALDDFAAALPDEAPTPLPPVDDKPTGGPSLLPPMELAALDFTELNELPPMDAEAKDAADAREGEAPAEPLKRVPALGSALGPPSRTELADEVNPHMVEAELLLAEIAPTVTGSPTGAVVSQRAQARIRRGYALAQRGASFAARREFLEVLQMIAEAKDQKHGAARRTIALAGGLRALEEAADFASGAPGGDAGLSLEVIISSHRTPVAKSLVATADSPGRAAELMPQQLADLYFRYAQLQLGGAVAGEPAGSMALHALGKVYSQLRKTEPEATPQADRCAFALQQAALLARNDNHLAAHELGVLLAESGHYVEAEHLLAQVAATQPHPVVFRNWARVQRKLGQQHLAVMSEQHARGLAARDAGGGIVTWVPPTALAKAGDAVAPANPPAQVANNPAARPRPTMRQPKPGAMARRTVPQPVENLTRLPGGYFR